MESLKVGEEAGNRGRSFGCLLNCTLQSSAVEALPGGPVSWCISASVYGWAKLKQVLLVSWATGNTGFYTG
jgi:hypothetical protein